ncbi:penicillin acylase family protein [Ammoniphilus sp. 3BR4]|uniref:penicillin acylase family protein n=1 Tax=Ammoniphilus sp. 3BR4 TaxID=3158265 RepID=UPI0034678B56
MRTWGKMSRASLSLALALSLTTGVLPSFAAEKHVTVSQTEEVKVKQGTVKVIRDSYGVPHIYAQNLDDLYKAYGYVMAKDRLFQLEMFKRGNEGTAAEVFGERYFERDQKMRRDGYSDAEIKEMIKKMDPFSQKVAQQFAEGISLYVEEALKDPDKLLSKEFHDYKLTPEKWSDVDIIRLWMSSMTVFMDQEQEVKNAGILASLEKQHGKEKAKKLFDDIIYADPFAVTTIEWDEFTYGEKKADQKVSQADLRVLAASSALSKDREDFIQASEELSLPLKVGSNALVISPKKSKSGNALLMSGPQVGLTAPGFIYEVGLHSPDFNMQGSGFIGYPFIMFGSSDHHAQTATAGFADMVDIYQEELNPANPYQYKYQGKWVDMEKKTQTFKVKNIETGKVEETKKDFYYTVHGPVVYLDEQNHLAYTKKWVFRGQEAQGWEAYVRTNHAKDLNEWLEAARDFRMSLNWFYADKEGNTAYYHVGQQPVRDERVDWRLPTPGTGEYEWKGWADTKDNPHVINPKSGYIANWNNKPSAGWDNNESTYSWAADNRVQQFKLGVESRDKLDLQDVNDINYHASFVNLRTTKFKPFLIEALEKNVNEDDRFARALELLKGWNNLAEDKDRDKLYDSPAVALFEAWWPILVENVIKDDLGEDYNTLRGIIDHRYGTGLLLRILEEDKASAPTQHDWMTENRDELILSSLKQALDNLEKEYGLDMAQWNKPIRTVTFGGQSLIGVPHGLGSEKPIIEMNRGSENHFVELKKDGQAGFNLTPPGQIGFVEKDGTVRDHYEDQIEMYENFEYKPILFTDEEVLKDAVSTEMIDFGKKKKK